MRSFLLLILLALNSIARSQGIADLADEAGKLFLKGEYAKAIPVAEKAAAEIEKAMGQNNMFYHAMLLIAANSYSKTFQYPKAETLMVKLCELQRQTRGERGQKYATCLNNLALVYNDMGLFDKAEPLIVESMKIIKAIVGETDSAYSYSLNNAAGLYHSMGQYQKAEPLYLQAIEIRKKVYGVNHQSYAMSLNNLGTLYLEMGQTEKAEPLFLQSLDIRKKTLGESHPDYAMSLNNLASLYEETGQYAKSEPLYIQANEIRKKITGEMHPDYAMGLNNLASLYTRMLQFKKTEILLIQARDIWKKILGENHPRYATALNNVAAFYRKSQMQYAQAEIIYKEAIALRKRLLGESHPFTADTENDLAMLYSNMKQYAKAEPYLLSSSRSLLRNMLSSFTVLSEKEKSNYLDYNFVFTESNNSFLYNYPAASAEMIRNSFNLQLGFKSLSLSDTRNVLESVRDSKDTAIRQLLNNWQVNKVILARQYALPAEQRLPDLKTLEQETEALEKGLNRRSAAFRDQQKALKVTIQELQNMLGTDEVAIEFVRFRLYTDHWADTVMYAAYVIKKNDPAPKFIPLCRESQIQSLFDKAGSTPTVMVDNFYRGFEKKAGNEVGLGKDLYKLVWQPLESHLKGIKKISYSPAGKLHSIAFHALASDSNSVLIDKYRLEQYTSTRQLALRDPAVQEKKPGSIVLFGDARFTMDSTEIAKKQKNNIQENSSSALVYTKATRGERGGWGDLPGTAEEVRKIAKLFEQQNITNKSYVQSEASEENLKGLSGNAPQILHVATHGFFLPVPDNKQKEKKTNSYKLAEDPLMRSGLVLAGGNYVWNGRNPLNGVEDGIATAYEISQLNLSNTDLVVLSACETALGDIKGSEGVFGLQRSFKMAGVRNLVVSLWQVPDKETVELMTAFYTYRMQGENISGAFYRAQADMRKKYLPFYWAAFVLVE